MRTNSILMLGVVALALASCGRDPASAPQRTDATPPKSDRVVVDGSRVPGPVSHPKSRIGYVRREVPAGPPPADAVRAVRDLEALRREMGDERFAKAIRVLSCRAMKGSIPDDPMADFSRRAGNVRRIAAEGGDLDAELDRCARERSVRR